MNARAFYLLILLGLGAGWGLTTPLSKIAVSTGYQHFGLIVWQLVYGIAILGAISLWRRRGLPLGWPYLLRYALIALAGTVIPNSISYQAAVHLPAGIMAITISLVPIFALPMALAIGMERFQWRRMTGVVLGAVAMVLLVGPETSLPSPGLAIWVLIGALAPFCYAVEATWVARYGTLDLDPVDLMLGASISGLVIVVPLAWLSGQWIDISQPWGVPDVALLASSLIHAGVYTSYVWLVGRAGSVFASQTAYLVTGTGVLWSMLILSESYSPFVWAALVLMLGGMFLVRPAGKAALAETLANSDNGQV
ncbi:MAG: DMT family transporter [Rhodobacteraceae bacterium]|nr:DMT family transporter [Paracoccaceae bacterium]